MVGGVSPGSGAGTLRVLYEGLGVYDGVAMRGRSGAAIDAGAEC